MFLYGTLTSVSSRTIVSQHFLRVVHSGLQDFLPTVDNSFQNFSGRVKQMTARSRPLPGMDRKTILISVIFVHLRIMEPMMSLT